MNEAIIEKAQELAKIIKEDERTQRMLIASVAFDASLGLKTKMQAFSEERDKLLELIGNNASQEETQEINAKVKGMYDEIMDDPIMIEYDTARKQYDGMLAQVNSIINYHVTGETGTSCDASACEGCAGCSGR